jgi:predicted PhzF superfamily epimerase YddE/YHI9
MRVFQVDSFASRPFEGNPAAVCLLDHERDDGWMQRVAAEMNLSETAFVLEGSDAFRLRWLTPTTEVALCGHATLASAHILWETGRLSAGEAAVFETVSGRLVARRVEARIEMDLPASPATEEAPPAGCLEALSVAPTWVGRTADRGLGDFEHLVVLDSEDAVLGARPDFQRLRGFSGSFIVTARAASGPFDFVSRCFAPAFGIDEDPVTGAAHCTLVPYWAARLGKVELVGHQVSARGGVVRGRLAADRVHVGGEAVTVLRGELLA